MKTKIVLALLLVALVVGCKPKTYVEPTANSVDLAPVWAFRANGVAYNVYEFTDRARGEHCYVIAKIGDYHSGVALSCEKVGE